MSLNALMMGTILSRWWDHVGLTRSGVRSRCVRGLDTPNATRLPKPIGSTLDGPLRAARVALVERHVSKICPTRARNPLCFVDGRDSEGRPPSLPHELRARPEPPVNGL